MPTAIAVRGIAKPNNLLEWEAIIVHFDDGTIRELKDITATPRQLFALFRSPADYAQILEVDDGEKV